MPKKDKNVLAIMLGGKKRPPVDDEEYEEEEEEGGEYGGAFKESAAAVMSAIESGDSEDFASSLKDAIVTCVEEFHEEGGE